MSTYLAVRHGGQETLITAETASGAIPPDLRRMLTILWRGHRQYDATRPWERLGEVVVVDLDTKTLHVDDLRFGLAPHGIVETASDDAFLAAYYKLTAALTASGYRYLALGDSRNTLTFHLFIGTYRAENFLLHVMRHVAGDGFAVCASLIDSPTNGINERANDWDYITQTLHEFPPVVWWRQLQRDQRLIVECLQARNLPPDGGLQLLRDDLLLAPGGPGAVAVAEHFVENS